MSDIRKTYMRRLVGRCFVLAFCIFIFFYRPEEFKILETKNFFQKFSVFHILWGIWVVDMLWQLIPVKKKISLGSQKLFQQRFKPIREKINYQALRQYIISTTKAAYKVMIIWLVFLIVVGIYYYKGIINNSMLFMISVIFYVCDLICVLIWCPFRLILKNRCCTTCRIFNWDHLMMFTPMIFITGFYSYSLVILSVVVWLIWELCIMMYPERFWENSNIALRCSECTDKLCTQYCQKLVR